MTSRNWRQTATVLMLTLSAAGTLADDSGMYRGPENNGIYPETGILRKWPEGGPKFLWKQPLRGSGFSSVTVADGKVYATEGTMCSIHVFSLDGKALATIPSGPSIYKRFGGGSRGTTVVRGNMAIAASPESDVYAVDLEKQEMRWQFNASRDWGEELGQGGWGYCESPILFGDKIILGATSTRPEDPLLMAFDVETGDMVWGAGWGNPAEHRHHYQSHTTSSACFRHNGRNLIASSLHSYHSCVDAETGRLLWQFPNRGVHSMTSVYNDGLLLIHCDNGWRVDKTEKGRSGIQMLRLSDDGSSYEVLWSRWEYQAGYSHAVILDGRVYVYGLPAATAEKPKPAATQEAVSQTDGHKVTRTASDNTADDDSAVVSEADITNVNKNAAFLCLDAKTGALIASHPVSTNFVAPGHVVSADGLVFFLELLRGKEQPVPRLVMFEPTAKGFEKTGVLDVPVDAEDLKVKEVEWQGRTPPVIAEKRLFVRYGSIFAFDIRRDQVVHGWRQNGSGVAEESNPPVDWNEKRNVQWTADLPVLPASSPVTDGEKVFVMGAKGDLVCLQAANGKTLWRDTVAGREAKSADGEPASQPTPQIGRDHAYAVANDGTVVALRNDGTRKWKTNVEPSRKSPMSSPLLAGEVLVVQGRDLTGLNAEDGKSLWRVPVPDGKSYGTPAIASFNDCRFIVTCWGTLVKADDGSVVAKGLPAAGRNSPSVHGQSLYFWERAESGRTGSRIVAMRIPNGLPGPLTPAQLWEKTLPEQAPGCSMLVADNILYGLTEDGAALALDTKNGATCYMQELRDAKATQPAFAPERSLVSAGHRIYAVNADGSGCTHVFGAGPTFKTIASYTIQQGVGEPAFWADKLYVTAGARLYCMGGTTLKKPEPVSFTRVAALPVRSAPKDLPIEPFGKDKIPDTWIVCDPIPGKTLDTDHLAGIGGRSAAMPAAGEGFAFGGTNFTFRKLAETNRWRDKATADLLTIDVTSSLARKYNSTAYFFTVVENDVPRYVRLAINTPGPKQQAARFECKVWFGGEPMAEGEVAKIGKGFYPLMLQVAMGRCDAWGRIWMAPRFEDLTEQFNAMTARSEEDMATWKAHVASAMHPFVLTPVGVRRTVPDDATLRAPATVTRVAMAMAEGKNPLDVLGMKFVAIPERNYEMQTTEVTQGQWFSLIGTEPWKNRELTAVGPEYPVTHVSWWDAVEFAERLTRMDGKYRYRLPKEEEWRHAAQTGLNGRWCFGSNASNLAEYAWFQNNAESNKFARPVGQLKPSAWGLYDMNGNVSEWCGDEAGKIRPGTSSTNPKERYRITKGGAWYSVDWFCDVYKSPQYGPLYKNYGLGFRVLREPVAGK